MSARLLTEKIKARLGKETGAVHKNHAGRLAFALAFPNIYRVGMSNLGFQIVYRILNERDDSVCERVFLPDSTDLPELERSGALLVSMESQTPIRDFDFLAFSLSFEMDYPNVLRILSLAGITEQATERGESEPVLIAGGPAATFNPEPLAPFIDVFVIGEAEAILPGLVDLARRELGNCTREELLSRMARIPGVYAPRFYEPSYNEDGTIREVLVTHGAPECVSRQFLPDIERYPSTNLITTPETEFSNMILAEVARGCGRQCRFCVAGYAYLPPRPRSAQAVIRDLESHDRELRVGLLSASVFDHQSSKLICDLLVEQDRLFSISSTRADTIDKDIVEALRRGGHETLTIAPEAGTDRLRAVINKTMTDAEVLSAAAIAMKGGFRRLKLYFMIGLPTETPEDVEAIPRLTARISDAADWDKVSVSVSCFVPKPWTPFQWSPMQSESELSDKLTYLRKTFQPMRRVEMLSESAREAVVQGVLARGDRRVGAALSAMVRDNLNWRAAWRAAGIDPAFYTQRPRHRDEVLPWDHIRLGTTKDYLWAEYERALSALPTLPCNVGVCRRCGVCRE
jgi:radical SAM family uncharacterized protein